MHVPDAREKVGLGTIPVLVTLSILEAYVSVISWSEYVTNCTETLPPAS